MHNPRPIDVLFLVDFSDFSFRTIPYVAQLADVLAIRLTLLHVRGEGDLLPLAEERLFSFFAEADRYSSCERVVASGTLEEALAERKGIDLLLMPASTPSTLGALRPFNPSRRFAAVAAARAPVWTVGPSTRLPRLGAPTRNVVCWLDLRAQEHPQLAFAREYARALRANLHLMAEVPELTVPSIRDEDVPLNPVAAVERLREEAGLMGRTPQVWVGTERSKKERLRMLDEAGADVLFVSQRERPLLDWFGVRPFWLTEPACPVMMVPPEPRMRPWQLTENEAWLAHQEPLRRAG